MPDRTLNVVGLYCPMPILKTKVEIERMEVGQTLEVLADDPAAEEDIRSWAKWSGQELIEISKEGDILHFLIKKVKK